jgi:hypothetical protein
MITQEPLKKALGARQDGKVLGEEKKWMLWNGRCWRWREHDLMEVVGASTAGAQ